MSKRKSQTITVDADTAQATTPLLINKGEAGSISIIGTAFVGTITLQDKLDGTNWGDVDSWTADARKSYYADENVEIRLVCKSGEYTSGSAVCRVGR